MRVPDHVHDKNLKWWLRLLPYLGLTAILTLAFLGLMSGWFSRIVLAYAVFRLYIWMRGSFQCFHCLTRLVLALSAAGLLFLELPKQYYIAALLLVLADYFLRFGHQFITEDPYEVRKLRRP